MKEKRDITSCELTILNLEAVCHSHIKQGRFYPNKPSRTSDCLAYYISGNATYFFNDKTITVQPGSVIYLPYKSTYYFDVLTPVCEVIYINFNFVQDENFINNSSLFHIAPSLNVENSFRKLHKNWLLHQLGSSTECLSILYEIYAKILKNHSSYIPSSKYNLLKNAMDFIFSNYTNNISVKEIASHTKLSEGHFRRLFKEVYNVSPIVYITNLKLEYAKELLITTNHTLADIADFTGFPSAEYLSRLFKKNVGYTPSEFRKLYYSSNGF